MLGINFLNLCNSGKKFKNPKLNDMKNKFQFLEQE